ncbi:MAG: hypothetical protein FJZ01_09770 [Candidatus Sericytochromatia bacterium]|nr:hypothetical protein [Candidatus Tanganyikabacteria bacterium]
MPSRLFTLIALLAAAALAGGCSSRGAAPNFAQPTANAATAQPAAKAATVQAAAKSRVSKWTIEDLSKAEGRKLKSEVQYGDRVVSPDLTAGERALLERLLEAPPGTSLKDADLAGDHVKRVHMQSEFVYQHDGSFHRAIWRVEDAAGRTLGYRIHSQPRDLMSGKYIVAFYGADARLLLASAIWY